METIQLSVPITPNQVFTLAHQLPRAEKELLLDELRRDIEEENVQTHLASEAVLAKEWLTEKENQAWSHL